jgi:hypothetical protein
MHIIKPKLQPMNPSNRFNYLNRGNKRIFSFCNTLKKSFSILFILILFACQKDNWPIIRNIQGFAQKGPFLVGSDVTISELDKNLNPTGKVFFSTIDDNKGRFKIPEVELASQYIQVKVEGKYYHEVWRGFPHDELTLYSLADLSEGNFSNVNLLTHIQKSRVELLVKEG